MKDKGVPKTGDKLVRKPPRQRGNSEIRPFKAPRLVTKDTDSNNNTEVQAISETPPDCLKSPVQSDGRVPGEIVIDKIRAYVIAASPNSLTYDGRTIIPETEIQESSGDRPVERSLRNRQKITLYHCNR
jgi:hypothetical protein